MAPFDVKLNFDQKPHKFSTNIWDGNLRLDTSFELVVQMVLAFNPYCAGR